MAGDSNNVMSGMFGGLLDTSDPQTLGALISGASFLKAAAPQMAPMNTAGRLGMAIADSIKGSNYQAKQTQDQQMGLLDIMGKQATIGQSMAKMDLLKQMMGYNGTQPSGNGNSQLGQIGQQAPSMPTSLWGQNATSATGSPSDGSASDLTTSAGSQMGMPTSLSGGSNSGGGQSNFGNPRLNALMGLSMMDGKLDTSYNIMKDMQTGYARDAGKYYIDPVSGKQTYMMDPTKGLGLDAQGNVQVAPGFADANAAIKGSETNATKGAEAKYSLLPQSYVNANGPNQGRPMGGSQFDYLFPNGAANSPSATSAPSSAQGSPKVPPGMPADNAAGIQARIAYAQNIADPIERKSFINAVLTGANSMPNPVQRKYVTDTFNNGIANLGSQQSQPSQGQGTTNQPPLLQSAAELDADKARQVGAVTQSQKPQLDYSTNAATAFQKMGDNITGRVSESQALLQRIAQSRDALTRFKAGGGNDARLNLAQSAQGIGMPTSVVDGIAGGDLSAAQEFQKYAAQEALQTMQQSLATDSGPAAKGNRLAMDLFIKNNPNITTDPRAIESIFNFQTKLHNDALAQSDAYVKYANDPSQAKDPSMFGNYWAHQNIASGRVNPVMQTGQAQGTTSPQPATQPPQRAIANLKLNPKLAAQFDAKYGQGASASVLGK